MKIDIETRDLQDIKKLCLKLNFEDPLIIIKKEKQLENEL